MTLSIFMDIFELIRLGIKKNHSKLKRKENQRDRRYKVP